MPFLPTRSQSGYMGIEPTPASRNRFPGILRAIEMIPAEAVMARARKEVEA